MLFGEAGYYHRASYFFTDDADVRDDTPEPETEKGTTPCKLPHTKTMAYTVLYNTGIDFRNAVSLLDVF